MNKYFLVTLVIVGLGGYYWMSQHSASNMESVSSVMGQHDVTLGRLTSDAEQAEHQGEMLLEDEVALGLFEDEDVTPAIVLNEDTAADASESKREVKDNDRKNGDALGQPNLDIIDSESVVSDSSDEFNLLESASSVTPDNLAIESVLVVRNEMPADAEHEMFGV